MRRTVALYLMTIKESLVEANGQLHYMTILAHSHKVLTTLRVSSLLCSIRNRWLCCQIMEAWTSHICVRHQVYRRLYSVKSAFWAIVAWRKYCQNVSRENSSVSRFRSRCSKAFFIRSMKRWCKVARQSRTSLHNSMCILNKFLRKVLMDWKAHAAEQSWKISFGIKQQQELSIVFLKKYYSLWRSHVVSMLKRIYQTCRSLCQRRSHRTQHFFMDTWKQFTDIKAWKQGFLCRTRKQRLARLTQRAFTYLNSYMLLQNTSEQRKSHATHVLSLKLMDVHMHSWRIRSSQKRMRRRIITALHLQRHHVVRQRIVSVWNLCCSRRARTARFQHGIKNRHLGHAFHIWGAFTARTLTSNTVGRHRFFHIYFCHVRIIRVRMMKLWKDVVWRHKLERYLLLKAIWRAKLQTGRNCIRVWSNFRCHSRHLSRVILKRRFCLANKLLQRWRTFLEMQHVFKWRLYKRTRNILWRVVEAFRLVTWNSRILRLQSKRLSQSFLRRSSRRILAALWRLQKLRVFATTRLRLVNIKALHMLLQSWLQSARWQRANRSVKTAGRRQHQHALAREYFYGWLSIFRLVARVRQRGIVRIFRVMSWRHSSLFMSHWYQEARLQCLFRLRCKTLLKQRLYERRLLMIRSWQVRDRQIYQ